MSDTVTVTDSIGNEFEVLAGIDGENPVSPNNPAAKAVVADETEEDGATTAKAETSTKAAKSGGTRHRSAATTATPATEERKG